MDTAVTPELTVEVVNGITVLTFNNKRIIDGGVIQRIKQELLTHVQDKARIILDYQDVTYQSSNLLYGLKEMDKAVKKAQGKWRLCNLTPDIYEVFARTNMNDCLKIKETREEALQDF